MRILVACEESQTICKAFRERGFKAFSCDLQDCSGGKPEWHIKGDAVKEAYSRKYTLMIAHPPCTFLSNAGATSMHKKGAGTSLNRFKQAMQARELFFKFLNAPVPHIVVENPTPLTIVQLPPPSQVIQPFEFGDPFSKRTLLWLKSLPLLRPTQIVKHTSFMASKVRSSKDRSKTFPGIANAIADQYGYYLNKCYE